MCKGVWTFQRAWGGGPGERRERRQGEAGLPSGQRRGKAGDCSAETADEVQGVLQVDRIRKNRVQVFPTSTSRQVSEQVLDDSNQSLKPPQLTEQGTSGPPQMTRVSRILLFWTKKKVLWEPSEGASNSVEWRRIRLGLLSWDGWGSGHVLTAGQDPQNHVSESMHFWEEARCSHQILRGVHDPQKG